MPPPATPGPAAAPREETVPYEVEKPERRSSRPPPPDARVVTDATLVGLTAQERPASPGPVEKDESPTVIVQADDATDATDAAEEAEHPPSRRQVATDEARKTVSEVATRLGEGFRRAGQSLAASTAGDFETLLPSDLGEESTDPLAAMSARLVRESDFWRRLALRALGRASFADRLGYTAGVVSVLTSIGLAIVAGLGGLFAGGNVVAGRAVILFAGALAVATGAGVAFALTHTVRRAQRDLAHEALARADVVETRHHRLSAVLALRAVDAKAFREALARLLGDPPAADK